MILPAWQHHIGSSRERLTDMKLMFTKLEVMSIETHSRSVMRCVQCRAFCAEVLSMAGQGESDKKLEVGCKKGRANWDAALTDGNLPKFEMPAQNACEYHASDRRS